MTTTHRRLATTLLQYISVPLIWTAAILVSGCSHPWIESGFQMPISTATKDSVDTAEQEYSRLVEELQSQVQQLEVTNQKQKTELSEQKAYTARLKMAYLAKHAQVNHLVLDQQTTIQEMVRIQSRLMSRNSRAETVSTLAEATMLVNKAEKVAFEEQMPVVNRANQLLLMSHDALNEENFDGATFLANQSAAMVQGLINSNSQLDASQPNSQLESRFALPIKMKTLGSVNLRSEPNSSSDVVMVLEANQEVQANGYRNDWIHVTLSDQQGWIFYKLIELAL